MRTYANRKGGRRGSFQYESLPINFWKACPDLQKEKEIHKWAGIVFKSGERSGAALKDYYLKENKQKSGAVTQSVDITDLEITSVLLQISFIIEQTAI